jgi:ribosomal peptide maturation radical SAM protein 1
MQDHDQRAPETAGQATGSGIVLVVPPFHGPARPALGLSLFKANLEARGLRAEVLYLNLLFARRIGLELYERISFGVFAPLAGEMIFSQVLFDRGEEALDAYVTGVVNALPDHEPPEVRFPDGDLVVGWLPLMRRLAAEAGEFCRGEASREILDRDPWMVGVSSSFEQNCSSLAVLSEIKKRRPEIRSVMGGANCEGEMGRELFATFPILDFVGMGDCDHSFMSLVESLVAGGSGAGIPGILARGSETVGDSKMLLGPHLDALPHPDFSDYFATLASSEAFERINPTLLMETARGCWWGAKKHCNFCGLNGGSMAFRSKTPDRIIEELEALVERYGVRQMEVVDNILDMNYFNSVLPRLAENPGAEIFWESKANLTREKVRTLARAGVRWLQPGIESLSDLSLKLMRKGSTTLQNVQLLRWCSEEGVHVTWGHLYGFPGEDEDEIRAIAQDMEMLHHYTAPNMACLVQLQRFSPYFDLADDFGLAPIDPSPFYYFTYPLPDEAVRRIAFVYTCEALMIKRKSAEFATLQHAVASWQASSPHSHLLAVRRARSLVILDTRSCARRFIQRLTGVHRKVYEYCDERRTKRSVVEALAGDASEDQVRAALRSLVKRRLMMERDGRYLSLATDFGDGYRAFFTLPPSGSVERAPAPPDPGRLRRKLRDALLLRIPPRRVAGSVVRRLRVARTVAKSELALRIARRLAGSSARR